MYSVVMMLALSGGAETPDFGHWGCGCHLGWRIRAFFAGNCGCGCRPWRAYRWGCHGCYGGGCYGCQGVGCVGCAGYVGCVGCAGDGMPQQQPPYMPNVPPARKTENSGDSRATIMVQLPPEAKLIFNGWKSSSNSPTRQFRSLPLEPGKDYTYTVQAEVMRDGQRVVLSREVTVRAGRETQVSFDFPAVRVTSVMK
jgi:uncharacterized protein (TIGR03000 family)